MGKKRNESAGNGTGEGESPSPLSMKDFQVYNRLSVQMDQFHNHFRLVWNDLQNACAPTGKQKHPRQLILTGLAFCSQLDFHHSIEEQHIFPVLAKKMPEFRKELDLLQQHKKIHAGLAELERYLEDCRMGDVELDRAEVKRLMDAFGDVLWKHLDEEVETLGARNMRRYWTVREMPGLPM
ncbi:hemerythrin domain-containing protein [Aspergillus ruber CBS 135680]|uniref:Hemerythrin-like domain-containing protein n=1 Tax=Aspergillus ruber (strain CBS 135680) TaxID=1388766 RepID=A0A017SCU6_ASPRC|nr:uncharacterized protein EURHEDRAFT_456627 [Aspergillus ruber CBS 135680]EYE94772.1 hypothetical protein EURHEDRAFT_456627 [Aspergillus ruber CBS 135680]